MRVTLFIPCFIDSLYPKVAMSIVQILERLGHELIELGEAESCCGFGGMFAVKYPQISTAMAEVKCNSIIETGVEYVVSNDSSCLMHIQGYLSRNSPRVVKSLHLAEVLAQQ